MKPFLTFCLWLLAIALSASIAHPEETRVRVATYAAGLSRDGPGLLLRDITKGEDEQIAAVAEVIRHVDPDILLLTGFDFDHGQAALGAFATYLGRQGTEYANTFSLMPNSGIATGLDMDGNGRTGEPRDAQGYGAFAGDGGLAILSRYPIRSSGVVDLSSLLWKDVPGATLPRQNDAPFPSTEARDAQRLSSTGHWVVPVGVPGDADLHLLAFAATPPIFDGPEDRNGLRNADEIRLWQVLLDGHLAAAVPEHFVILGNANLDPIDGDGRRDAMLDLLADTRIVEPQPRSPGGAAAATTGHSGDPALDTADWREPEHGGPGNLRVSYVLPSANLNVAGSGVFWPEDQEGHALVERASRHRLVWVDLEIGH